jgi:invasion protein IalB
MFYDRIQSIIQMSLMMMFWCYSIVAYSTETQTTFQDWVLNCPAANQCQLQQRIMTDLGSDKQQWLGWVALQMMTESEAGAGLYLIVRLPLGIRLDTGLRLDIDGRTIKIIPFHSCRMEGCMAVVYVDKQLKLQLERGLLAKFWLTVQQEQPLAIPVSLLGLTAGMRALVGF